MKKGSIFSALIILFAFTACEQDKPTSQEEDQLNVSTVASLDTNAEEAVEASFSDLDVLAEAGMDMLDIASNSAKRGLARKDRRDRALDCASVEKDTVNRVITIDFGDGCTGPHGAIRKGKIIVNYDGNRHKYGSSRTVILEDFYIDSVKIEGTRTIVNRTKENAIGRTIHTTMIDGKATFADGTTITRVADHTTVIVRGDSEDDDYLTRSGGTSGLKRDGVAYKVLILEDLTFKRGCVRIPVSGVKEVTSGDRTATFDYGGGACDNQVTVTVNGVTTTETIAPKGIRIVKRN